MKSRHLFLPALVLCAGTAQAQSRVVDHTKVRMYVNEEVTVEGPVARADRGAGGSVWFSIGKAHPNASLVVVVTSEYAKSLDDPRTYEGATIQVTGRVTTGEQQGIGMDRSSGPRLSGQKPRNPYIVLEGLTRFRVVTPAPSKP